MDRFDTVEASCPECGADVEFISRAGTCLNDTYDLDDAPKAALLDLDGKSEVCSVCAAEVIIRVKVRAKAVTS